MATNLRDKVRQDLSNCDEQGYWDEVLRHWRDEDVADDLLTCSCYPVGITAADLVMHVREWRREKQP